MNGKDLLQSLDHVDEQYIEEAETGIPNRSFQKTLIWFGSIAAAFCLLLWNVMTPFLSGGADSRAPEQVMQGIPSGDEYSAWNGKDGLAGEASPSSSEPNDGAQGIVPMGYAFSAQYIRTDGWPEGCEYPRTLVISSRQELEAYYEANRDVFDLERRETVYSDSSIGFLDACDAYDDAYFEDNNLILILLEEGSGSVRHTVTDVRREDGWTITIQRQVPAIVTDDMAVWHIFLSVQMGDVIGAGENIGIRFVNIVEGE